ncbi:hypothetical protein, partial [Brucella endophytica]
MPATSAEGAGSRVGGERVRRAAAHGTCPFAGLRVERDLFNVYPVHAITRKSRGLMTRKLSVT